MCNTFKKTVIYNYRNVFFNGTKPVFFLADSSYMFTVGNQWVAWPSMLESRFWVCAGCVNDARVPGNTSKRVCRLLALFPVVRFTTFLHWVTSRISLPLKKSSLICQDFYLKVTERGKGFRVSNGTK